jgi:L-lactate utilization protein LutB
MSKSFEDNNLINKTINNLQQNNFEVFLAENLADAHKIFAEEILAKINIQSASYGDSITMHKSGALETLKQRTDIEFIDTFSHNDSWRDQIKNRKRALTTDLFLTGTNAITAKGQLVNLDMIGNRVAALTFGPRYVVLFVGINKIVENLDDAFTRIRTIAAPLNAKRHENLVTPCQKTGKCMDCKSPQRICNSWSIIEKSYPAKRIKIILINEELGL